MKPQSFRFMGRRAMTAFVRKVYLLSTVAPLLATGTVTQAIAQSGAPASGTMLEPPTSVAPADTQQSGSKASSGLQDIIVTARRTNEKLQTTPVAVTALNNQALLTKQITEVTDLARATPALSIGTGGTGPASIVYLAIRGQAQNSPDSFTDAAIGIYIDGVYVGRPMVGNLGFLDMASAEVLRGPQGTLFGRNTTGGALNLTTQSPTDKFEGYVKAGYGNYDARVVEGVINIPISSDISARFAGRYDAHNGYYPDPYGHAKGDVAGEYYGRGSIKWAPSSLPVTLTVSGDYTHYRDHGNGVAVAAVNPNSTLSQFSALSAAEQAGLVTPGGVIPDVTNFNQRNTGGSLQQYVNTAFAPKGTTLSSDWRTTYYAPATGDSEMDKPFDTNSAGSFAANLVADLGVVTVKSITGYRLSDTGDSSDLTGTPTGGGAFVSEYKQHQFSEEVQVSGKTGGLQYVIGANYFREVGNQRQDSAIFYNTPYASHEHDFADFVSISKGIFAQANYNVTDRLRVTGGIRYTWDKREIDRHTTNDYRLPAADQLCEVGPNIGLAAGVAPCNDRESATFSYPAWTAGIDYKIDPNIFVYVKTSGASMSGGFNSRPVPFPYHSAFKPENVHDVETGFKGEFLDKHVRTNVAVFYAWQSKVQRIINTAVVNPDGTTRVTQFTSNAGDVNTYGLEFEGTVIPWRGMTIDTSFAYLHARYVKGSRVENQLVDGVVTSVDRSGEPITQAPKWTASIGGTQKFDTEYGVLSLHGDYAYISSRYFDFFTTGDPAQKAEVAIANEASKIRAYGLFNGQISFDLKGTGLEFALWGKNLGNRAWFTNVFNSYTGIGSTVQYQGAPRTFGGTVAYHW
jgi:iron complex outermembrane receptor protein